jgi:hypothetical protein
MNTDKAMVETEREILREKDEEAKLFTPTIEDRWGPRLGERKPFDSTRQATYEDSVAPVSDWEYEDEG